MTVIALVAMNLHEVLLGPDGRLPVVKLGKKSLQKTVPAFVASYGMDPAGAHQAGAYDTYYGVTLAYRLRTRARAVPSLLHWVHIDSAEVKSEDKHIIELVLLTEKP